MASAQGTGRSRWVWVGIYAAVMALLPIIYSSNYYIKVLVALGINTIIVLGLNLLMGYAGQVSIGHAAFYGIGAYALAIMTTKYGLPAWLGIAAAIIVGGLVAYWIAKPSLRLKGHYLAMATLGFAEIVHVLFLELKDMTGGTDGLYGVPAPSIAGFAFDTPQKLYILVWLVTVVSLVLALNIAHSRVGRALRAVHGSEIAAAAMGVDTAKYKIQVFVLSAILASVGGSLYVSMVGYVSPESFTLGVSITLVAMVVFGGMGNVWGAIIGASTLTILQEYLKGYQDYNMVIFGAILMLAMVFMPRGLIGAGSEIISSVRRRFADIPETAGEENAAS
ncbi:MAG TPA: branched-chain amino acid ABC transporter permease [Anaerolineae bacterium]|jgi:branched-chain amino acid transport system permease protein|nr:branched-chain amino acid ABC transporter permease [Anaerolineae bacterium]